MDEILVTGGAGYIGSHVVEILLHNNKQVRALDKGMFGLGALYPFYENICLALIKGELRNMSDLKKSLKYVDGVIHPGGIVGNPACSFDKLTCQDVNVTSTERLAGASAEAGIGRFVFASSCNVYSYEGNIFTEESELNPVDNCAEIKISGASRRMRFH